MDSKHKGELVQTWIEMSLAPQGSDVYEANFWAHEELWELCNDNPMEAWQVILSLVGSTNSEKLLGMIGAGPFEDLMSHHGDSVIALVEREVATNENLRVAMKDVWLDSGDTPVWRRFYEIAGIEPPFPEAG